MRRPWVVAALFACVCCATATAAPLIVAYVFPRGMALKPGDMDPHAITRINYAFVSMHRDVLAPLPDVDAANLKALAALRAQNPSLAILASVGGWSGSGEFSGMARTPKRRAAFIQSAMDLIASHELDGLDIDWEYPGQAGAGHAYSREDKQNFTLLLQELRMRFDAQSRRTGKRLYLTIAAGSTDDYLEQTDMRAVQRYVDTINLMSYDYYEPSSGPLTGNAAPLFTDPADPLKISADASVRAFEQAGVPPGKLVLGIPFYGHAWSDVPDQQHGLFQPGKPAANSSQPYSTIATLLSQGFTRYWDAAAQAPWLYDPASHTFISYDDPQSVRNKCRYVQDHHLAGVMFWHYAADNGDLLRSINNALRPR